MELGGVRYSHIVDPRTGLGLTNRRQVSVLAPDALTSDSLATALCVLGEEKGRALLGKYQARAWYVGPRNGAAVDSRRTHPNKFAGIWRSAERFTHF